MNNTKSVLFGVLFLAIWLFIRFAFGRITTGFDEAYYLSTVKVGGVYSGLITPGILKMLSAFLSPIPALLLTSVVFFVMYPFALWKLHGRLSFRPLVPAYFFLAFLLTNHTVWSANEVRPQQIGILIGLLLLLWHLRLIQKLRINIRDMLIMVSLWVLLSLAHVFSLFVFYALMWLLSVAYLIGGEVDIRRYLTVVSASLPAFILLLYFPPYKMTVFSIKWILEHSTLEVLKLAGWYFEEIFLGLWCLSVVLGALFMFLKKPVAFVTLNLVEWVNSKRRSLYFAFILLLGMLVGMQYYLGRSVYSEVYRNNVFALLFLQLGNVLFIMLLLHAVLKRLEKKTSDPVLMSVIFFGLLGVGALFVSLLMPRNFGSFGFTNWGLRVFQYMAFLALPLVADEIRIIFEYHPARRYVNLFFVLLILAGVVSSVLNVARPPMFYSYPYYWTSSDIALVPQVGPGFVYTVDGTLENGEVVSFLGWAYGVHLSPVDNSSPIYRTLIPKLCEGSLCYSPYPYKLLKFSALKAGGNFIVSNPESLSRGFLEWAKNEIGSTNKSSGRVLLILGNSTTNPEILELEERFLVPVVVNYSVITGPNFRYYHTIKEGRIKGDVKRAHFVIQFVDLNATPAVLVEGPCWDSVAAGVWFLSNEILKNPENWNYSIVVGEWIEKDGRLFPFLEAYPGDKNGFSPGDEIRIIKRE